MTESSSTNATSATPRATPPADHIVIEWADLDTAAIAARVEEMQQAQTVPLVRTVGLPAEERPSRWWWSYVVQMSLAGLAGALAAWLLIEVLIKPDGESADTGQGKNILFGTILAVLIGMGITLWDPLISRDWRKLGRSALIAAPIMLVTGLLGGFIAGSLYRTMVTDLVDRLITKWTSLAMTSGMTDEQAFNAFVDDVTSQLHWPRALAWMIVGVAVGVGVGAASRSWRRLLNTVVGGAVGGFVGGFAFDYFTSGAAARAVAIGLMGALIGLSMGLIETVRKSMWLVIRSGGMAGKQFILYRDTVTIGSAPDCDITLVKDPGIAMHHARITRSGGRIDINALDGQRPLILDGATVSSAQIRDGSAIQMGGTLLGFHEKGSAAVPLSGPVGGL